MLSRGTQEPAPRPRGAEHVDIAWANEQTGGLGIFVEPRRLYESPYTDHAPTGPDYVFPTTDVTVIVETLQHIRRTAVPDEVA